MRRGLQPTEKSEPVGKQASVIISTTAVSPVVR